MPRIVVEVRLLRNAWDVTLLRVMKHRALSRSALFPVSIVDWPRNCWHGFLGLEK